MNAAISPSTPPNLWCNRSTDATASALAAATAATVIAPSRLLLFRPASASAARRLRRFCLLDIVARCGSGGTSIEASVVPRWDECRGTECRDEGADHDRRGRWCPFRLEGLKLSMISRTTFVDCGTRSMATRPTCTQLYDMTMVRSRKSLKCAHKIDILTQLNWCPRCDEHTSIGVHQTTWYWGLRRAPNAWMAQRKNHGIPLLASIMRPHGRQQATQLPQTNNTPVKTKPKSKPRTKISRG